MDCKLGLLVQQNQSRYLPPPFDSGALASSSPTPTPSVQGGDREGWAILLRGPVPADLPDHRGQPESGEEE